MKHSEGPAVEFSGGFKLGTPTFLNFGHYLSTVREPIKCRLKVWREQFIVISLGSDCLNSLRQGIIPLRLNEKLQ